VRCLEQEVREMKDLLDSKDEQLDMLSRLHSFSPYSPPASAVSGGSHRAHKSPESARSGSADLGLYDTFAIHETSSLVGGSGADGNGAFYVGSSSGRPFLGMFLPQDLEQNFALLRVHLMKSAFALREACPRKVQCASCPTLTVRSS